MTSADALAKFARPKNLTYEDVRQLSATLRQWYFEKGGLFLSDMSRNAYFALQDTLSGALAQNKGPADAALDEETFEALRAKGSELHTSLTRDVGTRKESRSD